MHLLAAPQGWKQLLDTFAPGDTSSVQLLLVMLVVGGVLAIYIRFLYRFTNPHASSDSIARVFPLLTLVTIAVIAVVKGSLALSLGLVGALSIVRFRAAIKDPSELIYLFLCIGVGLALGAGEVWLAVALVVVATIFELVFARFRLGVDSGAGYLTVAGSAARFNDDSTSALALVRERCPGFVMERCEVDGDEGQLRVHLPRMDPDGAPALITQLRRDLPDCQISYVNADRLP